MSPRRLFPVVLLWISGVGPGPGAPVTAAVSEPVIHGGMANASAAVAVGNHWFATAGGDDNRIRVYPVDRGGPSVATFSLDGAFPGLRHAGQYDLEGCARIDDIVYWIGSHGRNKEGRERPERQRFLATRIVETNGCVTIESVGTSCTVLLATLVADSRYQALGFAEASGRAPESDGINIEGIAATPDGRILVGFRSPRPGGRAILAPLLNPREAIDGKEPRFGDPIRLDLGGRGIRDITRSGHGYFILAGSGTSGGNTSLFRWDGPGIEAEPVAAPGLKHMNPEGIAVFGKPGKPRLLVVSDDGHHAKPGEPPSFRSLWVKP